jgi:hypothetical protein
MSTLLALAWMLLPVAAWVAIARRSSIERAEAWAYGLALWLVLSGVLLGAFNAVFGSLSWRWLIAPVLIGAAGVRVWRVWFHPLADEGVHSEPPGAGVRALAALAVAVAAVTLATMWHALIAQPGGAPEWLGYSAMARTALSAQALDASVAENVFAQARVSPIPAWSTTGIVVAAREWSSVVSKFPAIGLALAVVLATFARLRASGVPYPAAALASVTALWVPGVIERVASGSDVAIVGGFGALALLALLTPARLGWSIAMGLCALAWNPLLGWPLALASLLAVGASHLLARRTRTEATVRRVMAVALGVSIVAVMVLAQADTFLAPLGLSHEPDLTGLAHAWHSIVSGAWLLPSFGLLIALWSVRHTVLKSECAGPTLWCLVATAGACCASFFGDSVRTTIGADGQAWLAPLLVPALVGWLALGLHRQISLLSAYVPATQTAAALAQSSAAPEYSTSAALATDAMVEPVLSLEEMRERLGAAFNAYAQGQLEPAIDMANTVLRSDDNHPDAHHLLGLIALAQKRPGDALRSVQRAIDVFPEHALFYVTVSEIYASQDRTAEVVEALANASRLAPGDMSIKTRLLMAKRKLLSQTAVQAQRRGEEGADGYAIIVNRPDK